MTVALLVAVRVGVAVDVGVRVAVCVGVTVAVGVAVFVGVEVAVGVGEGGKNVQKPPAKVYPPPLSRPASGWPAVPPSW